MTTCIQWATRQLQSASLIGALLVGAACDEPEPPPGSTDLPGTSDSDLRTWIPHPAWNCGMPSGIPAPPRGSAPAFEIRVPVRAVHTLGQTPYGMRKALELGPGTVTGPRLSGTVLDGGIDFDLTLKNGVSEIEQLMLIQSRDGSWAYLRACGVAGPEDSVRLVPQIDVDERGSLSALGRTQWLGTRRFDAQASTLTLTFFEVSAGAAGADPLPARIEKPTGVPAQAWECQNVRSPARGSEIFREVVNLGPAVIVGDTAHGTRSAIPITGGTVSGRIRGRVLNAGADFQLLDSLTLDARYLVKTEDGEVFSVRNCGGFGSLTPSFEARTDGPYAFLNEPKFVSDDPGVGLGNVTIIIRERR